MILVREPRRDEMTTNELQTKARIANMTDAEVRAAAVKSQSVVRDLIARLAGKRDIREACERRRLLEAEVIARGARW